MAGETVAKVVLEVATRGAAEVRNQIAQLRLQMESFANTARAAGVPTSLIAAGLTNARGKVIELRRALLDQNQAVQAARGHLTALRDSARAVAAAKKEAAASSKHFSGAIRGTLGF